MLDIECLDRIYLNGYVPTLQVGGQVAGFMTRHLGFPIRPRQATVGGCRAGYSPRVSCRLANVADRATQGGLIVAILDGDLDFGALPACHVAAAASRVAGSGDLHSDPAVAAGDPDGFVAVHRSQF